MSWAPEKRRGRTYASRCPGLPGCRGRYRGDEDRSAANPGAWEKHNLERFLDALAALTGSVDALMANRNEAVPDSPSWSLIAELLVGASGYE